MIGRDRIPKARAAFLDALRASGNISLAARLTGLNRRTVYRWRAADPAFAAAWTDALAEAGDWLEAEARRRAVEGIEEPVFQGGRLVGVIQRYSDNLLIALLKANKPEKYGNRLVIPIRESDLAILARYRLTPSEAWKQLMEGLAGDSETE